MKQYDLKKIRSRFIQNYLVDEYNILTTDTIKEMLQNSNVQMALAFLILPIKQQPWVIDCEDDDVRDFLTEQIDRIYSKISRLGLDLAVPYGYGGGEIIYDVKDGRFIVDDVIEAEVSGLQLIQDSKSQKIVGMTVENSVDTIPPVKMVYFTWKGSNVHPYGQQQAMVAYKDWFSLELMDMYESRYFERNAFPKTKIGYPPNVQFNELTGKSEDLNKQAAQSVAADMNTDSVIIYQLPMNADSPQWVIEEMQLADRSNSFESPKRARITGIFRAFYIPDRLVTSDNGGGSRAESSAQKDIYFYALNSVMQEFEAQVNKQVIDKLMLLNYGNDHIEAKFRYTPLVDDRRLLFEKAFELLLQRGEMNIDPEWLKDQLAIDDPEMEIKTIEPKIAPKPEIEVQEKEPEQIEIPEETTEETPEFSTKKKMDFSVNLFKRNQEIALGRAQALESYFNKQAKIAAERYTPVRNFIEEYAGKAFRQGKVKTSDFPTNIFGKNGLLNNYWSSADASAYLNGGAFMLERAAQAQSKSFEKSIITDVSGLAPEDAIDFFKSKTPLTYLGDGGYKQLEGTAKAHGFSTALSETEYISEKMQKSLTRALSEGWTQKQWTDYAKVDLVQNMGISTVNTYHLDTIFRTNIQSAYMAGQWQAGQDPLVKEVFPALQYQAVLDGDTRPSHSAMDGVVARKDDPLWDAWYPPNGYNCRCTVVEIMFDELDQYEEDLKRQPDVKPDVGFDNNVGKSWMEQPVQTVTPELNLKSIVTGAGKKWDAIFNEVTDNSIRSAINNTSPVKIKTVPDGNGAHYNWFKNVIQLEKSDLLDKSTIYHEYGHKVLSSFGAAGERHRQPDRLYDPLMKDAKRLGVKKNGEEGHLESWQKVIDRINSLKIEDSHKYAFQDILDAMTKGYCRDKLNIAGHGNRYYEPNNILNPKNVAAKLKAYPKEKHAEIIAELTKFQKKADAERAGDESFANMFSVKPLSQNAWIELKKLFPSLADEFEKIIGETNGK